MKSIKQIIREEIEDYRGSHQAPSKANEDSPMYDLTQTYGEDIYTNNALRYFGHQLYDAYTINLIQSVRNKPNARVKIYRAVPKVITNQEKINDYEKQKAYILKTGRLPAHVDNFSNKSEYYEYLDDEIQKLKSLSDEPDKVKINDGDWVTINPAYAREHGQSNLNNNYRVLTKTVYAKNLYNEGDINEWGYSENGAISEGVADKYAEKQFNIPDVTKQQDVQANTVLQKEKEVPFAYINARAVNSNNDEHIPIYKNPKSLENIEKGSRAIASKGGNVYVAGKRIYLNHRELGKAIHINDVYSENYLPLHYTGNNSFHISDSGNYYKEYYMNDYVKIVNAVKRKNPQYEIDITGNYTQFGESLVKKNDDIMSHLNQFLDKIFYGNTKYKDIINSCDLSKGNCSDVTEDLYKFLIKIGYDESRLDIIELRLPAFSLDKAHSEMRDAENLYHDVLRVDDKYIDLTGSQFGDEFSGIKIFTQDELKKYWNKITLV